MNLRTWYQRNKQRELASRGFCRREFLRTTLAIGSASLISNDPSAKSFAKEVSHSRRILVVGGGFSGLACAHELASVGYKVEIAEARNRVGGRVLSFNDFLPGHSIEGGGELIGENHPTWWAFAKKFNLRVVPLPDEDHLDFPMQLEGRLLSNRESSRLYVEMDSLLNKLNPLAKKIDSDQPWLSPDAAQFDSMSIASWIDAQPTSPLLKRLVSMQLASDNGVANHRASLLGLLCAIDGGGGESYWSSSETHRCRGGNQLLATKLAEAIGWDRIKLSQPVLSIQASQSMRVEFGDGRSDNFDDVVLAIPPSTWHRIRLTPALPTTLMPQMGVAVKYLVRVNQRVWAKKKMASEGLSDGMVSQTWEGSDPLLTPNESPACLVAFSGGPQAERCLEVPPSQRDFSYQSALEPLFPGIAEQIDRTRMMDWPKDSWTLGGYTFPAPGQITQLGPILRQGVGNLHFIGEHTCYAFIGYMEGALKSGVDLARRITTRDGI